MLFVYNFLKNYLVEYELNYKKFEDEILVNKEKEEWSYDVKVVYKWDKNWKLYVVIGNVVGSKIIDEC